MIESCEHNDVWFHVATRGSARMLCWACVLELIQESQPGEVMVVTREPEG